MAKGKKDVLHKKDRSASFEPMTLANQRGLRMPIRTLKRYPFPLRWRGCFRATSSNGISAVSYLYPQTQDVLKYPNQASLFALDNSCEK